MIEPSTGDLPINPDGGIRTPGKVFSEAQLTPLFHKRREALASGDPEARTRLMQDADGVRGRLQASLPADEQDQLEKLSSDVQEQFAAHIITTIFPGRTDASLSRLPETTTEADPQKLAALQTQLTDLMFQELYRDTLGGSDHHLTINRANFNKEGMKLLSAYGRDQLIALVHGLQPHREKPQRRWIEWKPTHTPRDPATDIMDSLSRLLPSMPLQASVGSFHPRSQPTQAVDEKAIAKQITASLLGPDQPDDRKIEPTSGEETISAQRLLREFDGTSLDGELLVRGEFDNDGRLIGFKTAKANMKPEEIGDVLASPIREGNVVENFVTDPSGEGVLVPWDEEHPFIWKSDPDSNKLRTLDDADAGKTVIHQIGLSLMEERRQWEEERLQDPAVPDFRPWVGAKRYEQYRKAVEDSFRNPTTNP